MHFKLFFLFVLVIVPSTQVEIFPGLAHKARSTVEGVYGFFGDKLHTIENYLGLTEETSTYPVEEPYAEERLYHHKETLPERERHSLLDLETALLSKYHSIVDRIFGKKDFYRKMAEMKESVQEFPSKLKPVKEQTEESIKKAGEGAKEYAEEKWGEASTQYQEMKSKGEKMYEETKEWIKEEGREGASYIGGKFQQGKEYLAEKIGSPKETYEDIKAGTKEMIQEGVDTVKEGASYASKQASAGKDYIEEKGKQIGETVADQTKKTMQKMQPEHIKNIWEEYMNEVPLIFKDFSNRMKHSRESLLNQGAGKETASLLRQLDEAEKEFGSFTSAFQNKVNQFWNQIQSISTESPTGVPIAAYVECEGCATDPISRCLDFQVEWKVPREFKEEAIAEVEKNFCGAFKEWGNSLKVPCKCTIVTPEGSKEF